MRTALFVAVTSSALLACGKGKPTHEAPPGNSVSPSSGSAAGGSNGSRPAPDIELPHSDGSSLGKTTGPLDEASLHKLQDQQFQGFTTTAHGIDAAHGYMQVIEKTPDHPTIWTEVTIAPCGAHQLPPCLPMDVAQWNADPRLGQLKAIMPKGLRDASDTVFEVGSASLYGTPMIYSYQLGLTQSHPSPAGTPPDSPDFNPGGFSYTNAYFLYYNDGVNQVRVIAQYQDLPKNTKEEIAKWVPKGDLENVAKAFMDVFAHGMAKSTFTPMTSAPAPAGSAAGSAK